MGPGGTAHWQNSSARRCRLNAPVRRKKIHLNFTFAPSNTPKMLEHFLKCSELDWSKMLPKMEHFAPFVLEHFNNSGAYIGAFRGGCKSERGEMLHLFGANAPVAVVNAPFAGEIAPASGGNTPAVGANTPKTGANPPGAGARTSSRWSKCSRRWSKCS